MSQQHKAKVGTNFWARERAPIRLVEQSKVKLTTLSIIAFIARHRYLGRIVDEEVSSWQANSSSSPGALNYVHAIWPLD